MRDNDWPGLLPLLRWLGYGGLIPFAALAAGSVGAIPAVDRELCLTLLRAYGLAIVSFIGALSWGVALASSAQPLALRKRLVAWSVVPSLIAFASFALPALPACLTLAVTAAIALLFDLKHIPTLGLPPAWKQLRIHLSMGAMATLLIGAYSAQTLGQ